MTQGGEGQTDFFRSRLDQIINMRHELVLLSQEIDWAWLEHQIAPLFPAKTGNPPLPSRFMLGIFLLKHIYGLSDEGVCERWVHDPYFQYFTGEAFFCHEFPHERSSMSHWRKRLGDKLDVLLQESLKVAHSTGALKPKDMARVTVDTTVQPKNITFPTDAKLMHRAIEKLAALAKAHGMVLRQSYVRVAKVALIMVGRYGHAKQYKRQRRQVKFLRTRLGRLMRDIRRKSEGNEVLAEIFADPLSKAERIRSQHKQKSGHKLYAWHAKEVECIGKGKPHKPYEFGVKVSITTTNRRCKGGMFVLHAATCPGRPHDSKTLQAAVTGVERNTGRKVERIYVDKGYQGHDYPNKTHVFRSGQKRAVHGQVKKELRRRSAVEAVIGHLKNDGHMNRNFLKGRHGDTANAVLTAAGYNFRLILKWLRELLSLVLSWKSAYNTEELDGNLYC